MRTCYIIALGSNRRHGRYGAPRSVIDAAIAHLCAPGVQLIARAPLFENRPIGPSTRRYTNGAILINTDEAPQNLLARLKDIERHFGRRRGQRWGARVIDLDIILWSGGIWASRELIIPHPAFRQRSFVITPLLHIAKHLRDPLSGLNIYHLKARLDRKKRRH